MQTSQAYIFRILQHFATKLGNFTNFDMLFLAVVKDFDFFAKMKIQFKRGMVHSPLKILLEIKNVGLYEIFGLRVFCFANMF